MKDMREHLEKLRVQISECELIRDLATDRAKRDLFDRMAKQFQLMVLDLEGGIKRTVG